MFDDVKEFKINIDDGFVDEQDQCVLFMILIVVIVRDRVNFLDNFILFFLFYVIYIFLYQGIVYFSICML